MKIGSFHTQNTTNYINQNKNAAQEALSKIAASRQLSGKDSANLIIADALGSQISSLSQGVQNSNEAVGMLQIADSTLNTVSQNADRLNELSVRYNSAALNDEQKDMLTSEFNATQKAMQDAISATTYNGKSLFSESMSFETGSGMIAVSALQTQGLSELSIDNSQDIQSFIQNVDSTRSDIGSSLQEFEVSITNSLSALSNLTGSASNIEETPLDKIINDFAKGDLKLQSSLITQAHQNEMLQQRVTALLV